MEEAEGARGRREKKPACSHKLGGAREGGGVEVPAELPARGSPGPAPPAHGARGRHPQRHNRASPSRAAALPRGAPARRAPVPPPGRCDDPAPTLPRGRFRLSPVRRHCLPRCRGARRGRPGCGEPRHLRSLLRGRACPAAPAHGPHNAALRTAVPAGSGRTVATPPAPPHSHGRQQHLHRGSARASSVQRGRGELPPAPCQLHCPAAGAGSGCARPAEPPPPPGATGTAASGCPPAGGRGGDGQLCAGAAGSGAPGRCGPCCGDGRSSGTGGG